MCLSTGLAVFEITHLSLFFCSYPHQNKPKQICPIHRQKWAMPHYIITANSQTSIASRSPPPLTALCGASSFSSGGLTLVLSTAMGTAWTDSHRLRISRALWQKTLPHHICVHRNKDDVQWLNTQCCHGRESMSKELISILLFTDAC